MSLDNITQFLEKLENDEAMQAGLAEAIGERDAGEAAAAVASFASQHGFAFSADDAAQAHAAMTTGDSAELDESELEAVAGGGWGKQANRTLRRAYNRTERAANRAERTLDRAGRHVERNVRDLFRGW